MNEENPQVIPVDWNDPEFQKKFIMAFNQLQARISHLEQLTHPLAKQARIKQLEEELAELRK